MSLTAAVREFLVHHDMHLESIARFDRDAADDHCQRKFGALAKMRRILVAIDAARDKVEVTEGIWNNNVGNIRGKDESVLAIFMPQVADQPSLHRKRVRLYAEILGEGWE